MRLGKVALGTFLFSLFFSAAWADIDTVRMVDFAFVPASLTISPGDTVVWKSTQQCCIQHTTTRSTGPMTWNATVPLNSTFRLTFTQKGTFNYFCSPHQGIGMEGTIVVYQPASSLDWAGLILLFASLGSVGIWMVGRKKKEGQAAG